MWKQDLEKKLRSVQNTWSVLFILINNHCFSSGKERKPGHVVLFHKLRSWLDLKLGQDKETSCVSTSAVKVACYWSVDPAFTCLISLDSRDLTFNRSHVWSHVCLSVTSPSYHDFVLSKCQNCQNLKCSISSSLTNESVSQHRWLLVCLSSAWCKPLLASVLVLKLLETKLDLIRRIWTILLLGGNNPVVPPGGQTHWLQLWMTKGKWCLAPFYKELLYNTDLKDFKSWPQISPTFRWLNLWKCDSLLVMAPLFVLFYSAAL